MYYECQKSAVENLNMFVNSNRHSILVEGPEGCGKTFIAKEFARFKGIKDFSLVSPNVKEIRDTIDACYNVKNDIVLCIENLDIGRAGASYALLKFLEEPADNIYIIVTCRNIYGIPDTIISRSTRISISNPTANDLGSYMRSIDLDKFNKLHTTKLYKCCLSFKDIDILCKFTTDQIHYFNQFDNIKPTESISTMSWNLGHFPDNSEVPVEFAIRYLILSTNSTAVKRVGYECLDQLTKGTIAKHAILTRFCFSYKYLE